MPGSRLHCFRFAHHFDLRYRRFGVGADAWGKEVRSAGEFS